MFIVKLGQQLVEGMMPAELDRLKRSNGNLPVEFVRNQETRTSFPGVWETAGFFRWQQTD